MENQDSKLASRRKEALADKLVRKLTPDGSSYVVWDVTTRGFGVRVLASGRKSFIVAYRPLANGIRGKERRFTIGEYPAWSVDKAREKAAQIRFASDEGKDHIAELEAEREASKADKANTFDSVLAEFIKRHAQPRQRSWKDTQRILTTNCSVWMDRPINSISKRDAYDLLEGFIDAGNQSKARLTWAWLKALWKWAAKRDIVPADIMSTLDMNFEIGHRERTYNDDEIKSIWQAADTFPPVPGAYLKLLLLTAVRKNELSGMRWSEFDDPENPTEWEVPFERTKSRKTRKPRTYPVPLPTLAQRILKGLPSPKRPEDADLVFPGRHAGKPLDPGSPMLTKVRAASGIQDFNFHACRHTIATWLQNQKHSEYEIGLVLNHAGSGVTRVYMHGHSIDLKRELLTKWADHVASVVWPDGVERLHG